MGVINLANTKFTRSKKIQQYNLSVSVILLFHKTKYFVDGEQSIQNSKSCIALDYMFTTSALANLVMNRKKF